MLQQRFKSLMNRYSAIIADDEEHLCLHLQSLLRKLWPELDIIGIAHNGSEALAMIKQDEPDIAFLDIKMPIITGINVALRSQGICHIVFITAYDEFAVQAFEHDTIDYLLKPVSEERLIRTVHKIKQNLALHDPTQPSLKKILKTLSTNLQVTEPTRHLQWIRAGKADRTVLIPADEICFFRANEKYTSVFTACDEYIIRKSIKELASELDSNQFWKINRGIIVNASAISSTKRDLNGRFEIYLKNNTEILIASRKYSYLFKQM